MPKRVVSVDYDGCLMHYGCMEITPPVPGQVTRANKKLIDVLRSEGSNYTKMIVTCGSARQSFWSDRSNRFGGRYDRGYCFPALVEFTEALGNGAELDRFLLADVHGKLEPGVSFKRATDPGDGDEIWARAHANWPGDETKLSILYAQMHHNAEKDPYGKITFDFIDDREDILVALENFFGEHPELIPKNVTLRLFRYAGGELERRDTVFKGTGFIDANYCQTVIDMSDSVAKKMRASDAAASSHKIDIAPNLDVGELTNRRALKLFRSKSESAIPQSIAQNPHHRLFRSKSESDIGKGADFKPSALP